MSEALEQRQVLSFSNYAQVLLGRLALNEISGASVCGGIAAAIPSVGSVDALRPVREVLLRLVCGLERSAGRRHLTAPLLATHIGDILSATRAPGLRRAFESYMQSWIAAPMEGCQGDRRITAAQELVRRRFSDPSLCIDDIARFVGLSRWHFERLFRRVTGDCLRTYIRRVRFDAAVHLLEHSMLSIKEISAAVGYAQPGSFNRQFRETAQVTPTQWRRAATSKHRYPHSRPNCYRAYRRNGGVRTQSG